MVDTPDSFDVLGLAPTDAYETLIGPGLYDVWVAAKVDVAAELEVLEREFGAKVAQARQQREAVEARRTAVATSTRSIVPARSS
jgi:hypothetical protein